MGFEKRPDWVHNAIRQGDRELLSRAGKRGAETRKKNAELAQDRAEVEQMLAEERQLDEEIALRQSTNEDIAPIE